MSPVIKRLKFDPEFDPVSLPIIKHRVFTAMEQAKVILNEAREDAKRIRSHARDVLNQAQLEREQERQRGYEQGLEEGRSEFSERVIDAEMTKERIMEEAEPEVIRMVMDIAQKVIGRELEKGAVVDVVKKAIAESLGQKVVVRVHPADFEKLKNEQAALLEAAGATRTVSVREDEGVSAGGCIVETELGTVDARLETQIQAIRKALGLS